MVYITLLYGKQTTKCYLEQFCRDDLESFRYMIIYFARGCLLGQSLKAATKDQTSECIKEKKMDTSAEELCCNLLKELATYFE